MELEKNNLNTISETEDLIGENYKFCVHGSLYINVNFQEWTLI